MPSHFQLSLTRVEPCIVHPSFDGTNMRRILKGHRMKLTEVQNGWREMEKCGLEISRHVIFFAFFNVLK
jgi:hypothetical protein